MADDEDVQQLVVNLDERTGEFRGGASGALYALGDDGVPSDSTLEPLRMTTINQKPPAGAQHPNGDALAVAPSFFRTGGDYLQVLVQDMYAEWPYENLGFDDYLEKLAWVVEQMSASRWADRIVYVPFNEPDFIWYELSADDDAVYRERMATFLDHWKTAVEYIRSHHQGARVMGPNDATFRARNFGDFLRFGRDNDVLPDFISWHQLPSDSLAPASTNYFRTTYATYRDLERQLGIDPIPININEYGGNRDLTVPGQLVQWVAMFEEAKVDAGGKAYWTAAGGLAGDVVETNKPGGGWWFYKMYADLGGDTVAVTRPDTTSLDALDAIAVIDDHRRQARIVAGGTADPFDVIVENIDREMFGATVHVRLSATTWSGQNSAAAPPDVIFEDVLALRNGSVTIPVRGLGFHGDGATNVDRMAAYEIVLSPGAGPVAPLELPWRASYEAENAAITSGVTAPQGTAQNWNTAAASGSRDVGFLDKPDSAVAFAVDVPQAGRYRMSIWYANQTGQPSQQVLTVNGSQVRIVDYQATLHWQWRTRRDVLIELDEGANQIRLGKSGPDEETALGEATLDRIDLELITSQDAQTRHYEAELAQSSGDVTYGYDASQQSGSGYATVHRGGDVMFVLYADEDGYYDVELRHSSEDPPGTTVAQVSLDRRPVDGAVLRSAPGAPPWTTDTYRLFLSAGVNRVSVAPVGSTPVRLDRASATRSISGPMPVWSVEAEDAALAGSAAVKSDEHASGDQYVGSIGQGPQNRLTFEVEAAQAGEHILVVHYANDERDTGHPYNADIVSRPLDISVNGAEPTRYWFKNTWSWANWWARGVPVTLEAGLNTIALYNNPAKGRSADGCPAPCNAVLDSEWAPNLDRFEIAPIYVPQPGR